MSIYPVRIKTWFPPVIKNAGKEERNENKFHRQVIRTVLEFMKCNSCNKKISMRNGWVFHSLPWGHGMDQAWCSERCLKGGKK